jgi:hypothetical protein
MTLSGTINITANWAQLDPDQGEAVQGAVVLMRPLPAPADDSDRIDAGYQFFDGQQGAHYTLTGWLTHLGGLNYLLVTNAVQG